MKSLIKTNVLRLTIGMLATIGLAAPHTASAMHNPAPAQSELVTVNANPASLVPKTGITIEAECEELVGIKMIQDGIDNGYLIYTLWTHSKRAQLPLMLGAATYLRALYALGAFYSGTSVLSTFLPVSPSSSFEAWKVTIENIKAIPSNKLIGASLILLPLCKLAGMGLSNGMVGVTVEGTSAYTKRRKRLMSEKIKPLLAAGACPHTYSNIIDTLDPNSQKVFAAYGNAIAENITQLNKELSLPFDPSDASRHPLLTRLALIGIQLEKDGKLDDLQAFTDKYFEALDAQQPYGNAIVSFLPTQRDLSALLATSKRSVRAITDAPKRNQQKRDKRKYEEVTSDCVIA